jgi:hypothetical protein
MTKSEMTEVTDTIQMLALQITKAIEEVLTKNPTITDPEIIMALLINLGSVLISIECHECRRLNKGYIERMLPTILSDVMKDAATQSQHSEHVH